MEVKGWPSQASEATPAGRKLVVGQGWVASMPRKKGYVWCELTKEEEVGDIVYRRREESSHVYIIVRGFSVYR